MPEGTSDHSIFHPISSQDSAALPSRFDRWRSKKQDTQNSPTRDFQSFPLQYCNPVLDADREVKKTQAFEIHRIWYILVRSGRILETGIFPQKDSLESH